jgi:hypothetical protein
MAATVTQLPVRTPEAAPAPPAAPTGRLASMYMAGIAEGERRTLERLGIPQAGWVSYLGPAS